MSLLLVWLASQHNNDVSHPGGTKAIADRCLPGTFKYGSQMVHCVPSGACKHTADLMFDLKQPVATCGCECKFKGTTHSSDPSRPDWSPPLASFVLCW